MGYATVERLKADQLPFILAHTGIKHNSGDFHKPIRERWLEGEADVVEGYIKQLKRFLKKFLI